jgi:hypothetical protein
VYASEDDVPPTFANDLVIGVNDFPGDADDPDALMQFAESLVNRYAVAPPMRYLEHGVTNSK